jgi:hypothetical protein
VRKYSVLPLAIIWVGLLVSGCASTQYGKLRMPDRTDPVTVETLLKNWKDYELYYAGLHAGHPSAVLFDRKDDDRGFNTERWFKVDNKELLNELIDNIERQLPIGVYYPRLWKIIGPDGHLYGYMFTSWDHAVMRAVDGKTLFVNDLPLPPYLDVNGKDPGVRTR